MRFSLNGLKQPLNRKRSRQYEWRNPICGSMLSLNVFNVYTITLLMLITTAPKLNGSKQWLLFLTILWGFLCGSSVNITGLTQVATVRWGGGWSSYMDSSLQGLSWYGWNDWDGPPGFSSWVSWHMEEALPKHKHEIGFLEANTQSHSHSIFWVKAPLRVSLDSRGGKAAKNLWLWSYLTYHFICMYLPSYSYSHL